MNSNQSDIQLSQLEKHKTVIEFLDAYITNEITEKEKNLVEQHLVSCQECQHILIDLSRLRTLFKGPHENLKTRSNLNPSDIPVYQRGVSALADTVLDHIAYTAQEQKDTQLSSSPVPLQPFQARKPNSKRHLQWLLGITAAVLCIAIVGGIWNTIMIKSSAKSNPKPSMQPFVAQWNFPADIPAVQHGQDVFALKYVACLNNQECSLIYAFRSSQHEKLPQVHVLSVLAARPGSTMTIGSRIQSLGALGEFEIGVISTRVSNRVGQSIQLQGLFPGQKTPWTVLVMNQVHPLRLGGSDISYGEGSGMNGPDDLPNMQVDDGYDLNVNKNAPDNRLTTLLALTLQPAQKTPATATHLYLRLDASTNDPQNPSLVVAVISQTDYIRLEGPHPAPGNPGSQRAPGPFTPKQLQATMTATAKK